MAEKITQKVEGQLSKSQKEFLLRQQVSLSVFFDIFFDILKFEYKLFPILLHDKGHCRNSGSVCCRHLIKLSTPEDFSIGLWGWLKVIVLLS